MPFSARLTKAKDLLQFMEYSPAGVRLGALECLNMAPVKSAGLARK